MHERHTPEGSAWAADRAMGLELEAVDIEAELEWAESQGRHLDVQRLRQRLGNVLADLAHVTDGSEEPPVVRINARRAGEAA